MIIILIKTLDEMPVFWKFITYITIPLSYGFIRILFYFYPYNLSKSFSLLSMIIITFFVMLMILKYKTNKFKNNIDINELTKKVEEEINGKKRIIRK